MRSPSLQLVLTLQPAFVARAATQSPLCAFNSAKKKQISRSVPSRRRRGNPVSASPKNTEKSNQQQLNLSVLRFTLGIPGFDESYLPRWIGIAFGSLLLLNHFLGSDFVTPAQLRSEVLGLCLAGFSVAVPYVGRFLKGANVVDRSALPEGNRQVFVMPEGLSDAQKEDLAWVSYIFLKNTNTISVLISVQDALCVRGYWNMSEESSKASILDFFAMRIQELGLSKLNQALYFPQYSADSLDWEMLPRGTLSVLVQPVLGASVSKYAAPTPNSMGANDILGFILLASSVSYAYSENDRAWVKAVSNKLRGFIS